MGRWEGNDGAGPPLTRHPGSLMGLCLCAHGEGMSLGRRGGIRRGLPRGLGNVDPALWGGVSGGLGGVISPHRESLGRAQETRACLGVTMYHPFQGAAPSPGPGLRP